jgi:histidinol-phosphate/aromatic aminotransferase/cobyric acid decarboxylase-like protein/GTP:adenosylcobinamide-phosphate guanylyltransferase
MQAIILAAGMGLRLKPLTNNIPKCLVPVNGVPILKNTLNVLNAFKINEVIIVVGYKREAILDSIGNQYRDMKITYVINDVYDKTNNIYSLWLAKDLVKENVLLIEGDIFFEKKLIKEALKEENQNIVLVDAYQPHMDGTVLEINNDHSIKRLIPKREQGEDFDFTEKYKTVNVYHFTKEFFQNYFSPNLDTYIKTQSPGQYYELALGVLIYIGNPRLYARRTNNVKWYEIDDHNDLERAEYLFSPPPKRVEMIDSIYGGFWRHDFIDFNYLYNLYFPTERIYNEFRHVLPRLISNYPSGLMQIRKLLSRFIDVPYQDLTIGNGASELIRLINRIFVKRMTIPVPGFNEYENTLRSEQINFFYLSENDFDLNPDEFLKSVRDSGSNTALIVNPNNPTSLYIGKEELTYIVRALKDLDLVIVDESFINFVDMEDNPSLQSDYRDFKNLLIIKSMSKEYGIPGLRLGYILSTNRNYIEKVSRELPIWNINSLAEHFLEIFIKHQDLFKASCQKIIQDRRDFYEALKSIPYLKLYPPQANYIFARMENNHDSTGLRDEIFRRHRILFKDCANKSGLGEKNYIRIAVRKKDENRLLIKALKQYGQQNGHE